MKDILYGVKLAVLEELDPKTQEVKEGGITCMIDTAESVEMEPVVNEGTEESLRNDLKILAVVNTDDLLYGYDLTLKDNTFDPEIAGMIEGGVVKTDTDGNITGYRTPMLSEGASKMKDFRLTLYVANYEGDSIKNYVKVVMNKCRGKVPKFSASKAFYAPEFEIKAREATKANKPIKSLEYVDDLPERGAPVLLSTKIGDFEKGETSITNIPAETTVAQLLVAAYVSFGGSKKIVATDGTDKEEGKILATDKLVVYDLTNPETLKTEYTLTMAA